MLNKTEIYRKILRHYEKMQSINNEELRNRKNFIYGKYPRVKEIDEEINLTGVKAAKIAITGNDIKGEVSKLKKHLKELKEEKAKILRDSGKKEDFLDMKYSCPKCKDTGFIDGKECSCFKQQRIDIAYNQSNIKDILKKENFKFFDYELYSDEKDENHKISPRKNMEKIRETCEKFIAKQEDENKKKIKNLLFYGTPGLGKTFLCNCIAKEMLDKGNTVIYMTASQLFKNITEEKFSNENDEFSSKGFIDDVISADLLIIDDLGTELSTLITRSEFFNIINSRMLAERPVIISSNLSIEDLNKEYSSRTMSRIIGNYVMLEFFGNDIRLKNKFGEPAD